MESHCIDNQWLEGSGQRFESINPADRSVVADFRHATAVEVAAAFRSARHAFASWGFTDPNFRSGIVQRFAEQVKLHSEELALALKQIRYTHVLAHFKANDRFVEHDFSIFNEVLLERRMSHHDPIMACTIVLADPIIQSLNDRHFTCLNHTLMQQLGTISQAMYMRLFFHFSTQFDGHHRDRPERCRSCCGG